VGRYDRSRPLRIDRAFLQPRIGCTLAPTNPTLIAVDGRTSPTSQATPIQRIPREGGRCPHHFGRGVDAVGTKLNAAAAPYVYSTYIGGNGDAARLNRRGFGGSAYVTGCDRVGRISQQGAAAKATFGGRRDAFVVLS